jgi:NADH-quinone oxidoreductase subunit M
MNEFKYTVEYAFPLLSEMLIIPLAAAIVCLCVSAATARWVALVATLADLALGILLWRHYSLAGEQWQFQELAPAGGRSSGGFPNIWPPSCSWRR